MTAENTIPRADLIRAVLDGAVVQCKSPNGHYCEIADDPLLVIQAIASHPNTEFRIRPEPVTHWIPLYKRDDSVLLIGAGESDRAKAGRPSERHPFGPASILRLEISDDGRELVSATLEAS